MLTYKVKFVILITILTIFYSISLSSQTHNFVSGIWNEPVHYIDNDITLASGDTLIIENGVYIIFTGEYEFEVSGSLIVLGNANSPVVFRSEDAFSYWKGIRFIENDPSCDSSYVNFAEIKYASNDDGGGIYITNYNEIKIDNSRISNCQAVNGGGIYLYFGDIELSNSIIEDNSANLCAGGIMITSSNITMENVSILNNESDSEAGGIFIQSCHPEIRDCEINNNYAEEYGGAILARNVYSGEVIENCEILNNYAGFRGGACYCDDSWVYIYSSTFDNNESYLGGAFHFTWANLYLENCVITNNIAGFGGGIFLSTSYAQIVNCLINYNEAEFGGAIYCISDSNPIIYNSNVLHNHAVCNGGAYYTMGDDEAFLINSIFYYNYSDDIGANQLCINSSTGHTNIFNCDIQNGQNGITGHPELMIPPFFMNNLAEEPEFVDLDNNFSLLGGSPCINAGTDNLPNGIELPLYDLAGNTRIIDGVVDIGAFEWQGVGTNDELEIVSSNLSNFPNPFNPSTTISFNVTQSSAFATIEIYNLKGQKVKAFPINSSTHQFINSITWNGTDGNNKPVSSGIYFARLKSVKVEASCKMLLLK